MKEWRLLPDEREEDSFGKMAVDEAILNAVSNEEVSPTLRFYNWPHPAVALGYFQSVKEEVDLEACERDGIEIFRRLTGGGAVYKDPKGELNYSLIIPESHPHIPQDILSSYQVIQQGVIEGLSLLGLNAELAGINDIVIEGKKISGNAQTRKKEVIFQHGTILLDFDASQMATYLKISEEKISDKQLYDIQNRVGTLKEYLPDLSLPQIEEAIVQGFKKNFHVNIQSGDLTKREQKDKERLYEQKYCTKKWNYWR